jgi:hypothetical protein
VPQEINNTEAKSLLPKGSLLINGATMALHTRDTAPKAEIKDWAANDKATKLAILPSNQTKKPNTQS